jgi:hypothetical protein
MRNVGRRLEFLKDLSTKTRRNEGARRRKEKKKKDNKGRVGREVTGLVNGVEGF